MGQFNCFNGETDKVDKDVKHLVETEGASWKEGDERRKTISYSLLLLQHNFPTGIICFLLQQQIKLWSQKEADD